MKTKLPLIVPLFFGVLLSGCAFNVSYLKQVPAQFTPGEESSHDFVLAHDIKVSLGTGFPTCLKGGTRWHQVGVTGSGAVFITRDQVVTVEASNIYEAQMVVSNGRLTGFYLPVEGKFAPVSQPIPIETQPTTTASQP